MPFSHSEWEQEIARRFGKVSKKHLKQIMELLGDPPAASNITEGEWARMGTQLQDELIPALESVFLASAEEMLALSPIPIEWGIINQEAANYARSYSFELVKNLTATNKKIISKGVQRFFTDGWTRTQLEQYLLRTGYGPVRGAMIATTEVTRAAVEGSRAIARALSQDGITIIEIWMTNEDELVCKICRPLNEATTVLGETFTHPVDGKQYDGPPAHIGCRCDLAHDFKLPTELS